MKKMTSAAIVLSGLLVLGITGAGRSAPAKEKKSPAIAQMLTAGAYSAKAKALVCSGCGPIIQQTLEKVKGLESISIDPKTSMVKFKVKKDASIDVAKLQKTLKDASGEMGMGADYRLMDIKKAD